MTSTTILPVNHLVLPMAVLDENGERRVVDMNSPCLPETCGEHAFKRNTHNEFTIGNCDFKLKDAAAEGHSSLALTIRDSSGDTLFVIATPCVSAFHVPNVVPHADSDFQRHNDGALPTLRERVLSELIDRLEQLDPDTEIRTSRGSCLAKEDALHTYSKRHAASKAPAHEMWRIPLGEQGRLQKFTLPRRQCADLAPSVIVISNCLGVDNVDEVKRSTALVRDFFRRCGQGDVTIADKDILECRYITESSRPGKVRRTKLNICTAGNHLFVVFDPKDSDGETNRFTDMTAPMKQFVQDGLAAGRARNGDSSAAASMLDLIGAVYRNNQQAVRNLADRVTHIGGRIADADSEALLKIAEKSLPLGRASNYIQERIAITADSLQHLTASARASSQPSADGLGLVHQDFTQLVAQAQSSRDNHTKLLETARLRTSILEGQSREYSDDIIRGGTIGILGGTFTLIAFELSHNLPMTLAIGIPTVLLTAAYPVKMFFRARSQGNNASDSLKKLF